MYGFFQSQPQAWRGWCGTVAVCSAQSTCSHYHDCLPAGVTETPGQVNVYDGAGNLRRGGKQQDLNAKQVVWRVEPLIKQVNAQQNRTIYYKVADYVDKFLLSLLLLADVQGALMPRPTSHISLAITDVRVDRLQNI